MAEGDSGITNMDDSDDDSTSSPSVLLDKQASQCQHQGARPKDYSQINQKSRSMFKEKEKLVHEDTGSSVIQDAWDTLCIKDLSSGTEKDVSSEIDPCLVQRCFEIDHERQTFYNRIKRYVNHIEIKANKSIEIDIKDKAKNVVNVVKKALDNNLILVEETLENINGRDEVLKSIEMISWVTDRVVRLYRKHSIDTVVLHIVGVQCDIEEVQIEISEIIKQHDIEGNETELCYGEQYDEVQILSLKRLEFKRVLDEMNVGVDLFISETCHVTIKAKDKQSLKTAKSALYSFLGNVKFKDIKLPRGARRLIRHPSRRAYTYVSEELQKENIRAFMVETDYSKAGMQTVKVCGLGDENTDNAIKKVQSCFVGKPAAEKVTAKTQSFLRIHDGSIILVENQGTTNCICYTSDLEENVCKLISDLEIENENAQKENEYLCTNHSLQILRDVGCLAKLKNHFPSIQVSSTDNNQTKLLVSGSDKDKQDARKEFLQLEERVQMIEVSLKSCKLELLQQDDQKALNYAQNRLSKLKIHMDVTDEVNIYSLDGINASKADKIINDSFIDMRIAKKYIEGNKELDKLIERNKGCIRINHESDDIILLCYTDDMQDEVNKLIEKSSQNVSTVSLDCKPFLETFLKRYGKSYVEELEEKHNVKVSFNNGICCLNGNVKDVETFREKLKNRFPMKHVFLHTNKGLETFIASAEGHHKLDNIAQTNKCGWGLKCQTIDDDDDDDDYITMCDDGIFTRWSFGEFSRTISLVLNYKVGKPDIVVYPVNTSMFTEYAFDIQISGGQDLHSACTAGLKENVGKVKMIAHGLNKIQCKAVAAVVICDTEKHDATQQKRFISCHDLKQSVQTILSEATSRKMKSVAFPLPKISYDNDFTPAFFTEAIVTGMMDFYKTCNSSYLQHIYLSGDQSVIASAFNSAEKHLKSVPSIRRELGCLDEGLFDKSQKLNIEVQVKSIFDVKAECIVVAISKSLDLKKGLLSGLLLEKATEDIQAKLSLKHQLNLREGETVVLSTKITGNKRVRTVILGYISKWKKDKRPNILLTFVKECCFAAQKEGCSSIAFPALGTGSLEYPQREAAKMMLDGVEQYSKETMYGNIKQIFITLMKNGDPVYNAFQNEQRRTSVYKGIEPRLVKPFGFPQLVIDTSPKIKVLEKSNLPTPMPSRFIEVDVNVKSKETLSPIQIHRSSDEMNDRIGVECVNQYQSFERSITRVLEKSEEDRATAILFHCTHDLSFSAADQVNVIVENIMKAKNNIYLSDVVISTENVAGFSCVQNSLLNQSVQQQHSSSMLMSFFHTKKQPQWSLIGKETGRIKTLNIQLIGVDQKALDTVSAEMENMLKSHDTALDKTATNVSEDDGYGDEDQTIFGPVTASIHPTIQRVLNNDQRKSITWKRKLKEYKIDLDESESDWKITGALESILHIEQFLDSDCKDVSEDVTADDDLGNREVLAVSSTSLETIELKVEPDHFGNTPRVLKRKLSHEETSVFCNKEMHELSKQILGLNYTYDEVTITYEKVSENKVISIVDKIEQSLKALWRENIVLTEDEIKLSITTIKGLYDNKVLVTISDNVINIVGRDSNSVHEAKHAILMKIGRLRPSKKNQNPQTRRKANEPDETALEMTKHECMSEQSLSKTIEQGSLFNINGLNVYVYVGDITQVGTTSIVSAANPTLSPAYGVARVISKEAGGEYNAECHASIKSFGKLREGECRETGAGQLKFNKVFHVVGPDTEGIHMISKALLESFVTAEKTGQISISVPAISSGISRFNIKQCAEQYYRALENFANLDPKHLRAVHFVDIDQQKVDNIREVFEEKLRFERSSYQITLGNGIHLFSAKGDITRISVDGVVCPIYSHLAGTSGIIHNILSLTNQTFKHDYDGMCNKNPALTSTTAIPVRNCDLTCKYVLFAVTPRWQTDYTKRPKDFERDVRITTGNILKRAHELKISTLAVPLLGSDNEDKYPTPLNTCCENMVEAVKEFFTDVKTSTIKEVHILSTDFATVSTFNECMKKVRYIHVESTV